MFPLCSFMLYDCRHPHWQWMRHEPWVFWQTRKHIIPASLGVAMPTRPFGCSQVRVFALQSILLKHANHIFHLFAVHMFDQGFGWFGCTFSNQCIHHLFLAHPALQNLTNESFVEISEHWNAVLSRLQVAWQLMYELGWMHSARQFAKSCQALLGW